VSTYGYQLLTSSGLPVLGLDRVLVGVAVGGDVTLGVVAGAAGAAGERMVGLDVGFLVVIRLDVGGFVVFANLA